jgi:hypothetical protein
MIGNKLPHRRIIVGSQPSVSNKQHVPTGKGGRGTDKSVHSSWRVGGIVLERICDGDGAEKVCLELEVGDDQKGATLVACLPVCVDVAKRKTSPPPEPNSRRLIGGNLKDDVPITFHLHRSTEQIVRAENDALQADVNDVRGDTNVLYVHIYNE